MPRYYITPTYGDVPSYVVDNESLRDAIENAFQAKLTNIARLHVQMFDDAEYDGNYGRCIMYAVVGALGDKSGAPLTSILCSATIITYSHDRVKQRGVDIASVLDITKEAIVYEPEHERGFTAT